MDGKVVEKMELPQRINGIWTADTNQIWLATGTWEDTARVKVGNHKYITKLWSKTADSELIPFNLMKNGIKLKPEAQTGIFIHRSQQGFWYIKRGEQLQLFDKNGDYLFNFHTIFGKEIFCDFISYFENESTLWVTTPVGLIKTKVALNPFRLIHKKRGFSDCRGITEDETGNIYFKNKLTYKWNPRIDSLTTIKLRGGYPGLTYMDNSLWTGHYTNDLNFGLQYDLRTEELHAYPLQGDTAHLAFGTLPSENPHQLLVGTDEGLCYVDIQQKTAVAFKQYNGFDTLKTSRVYHLHRNENGIWLATSSGIFLMTEKEGILRHYNKTSKGLPYDHIRHIYEDVEGFFWLATKDGGIIKWKPALESNEKIEIKQLTTKDGLSHNSTYGIYEDNLNKLWISSDVGLMRMDKEDLLIETFLVKDGLPHNEFNTSSHYQAKDSTLYFGGLGGLISFDPNFFAKEAKIQFPLDITKVTILEANQKDVTDYTKLFQGTNKIVLQPTDKFVEFQLALLDYEDSEHHLYVYKIEGHDDNWIKTRDNYLRINSLPYGNYTLKIKGKNNRSNWSKELVLPLIHLKPFYLQTWFLTLLILMILLTFRQILDRREVNLKKQNKLLEDKVKERTLQLEKVGEARTRFFNNITHEVRTPLTLILGPAEQLLSNQSAKPFQPQVQLIKKNATHLLETINQLLDISKIESGAMKIECSEGDIIAFCQDLVERFQPLALQQQQKLSFIREVTHWKTYFDKKKLTKIIHNLLSNALKFTEEKGVIQLSISRMKQKDKDYIALIVKDTGKGISAKLLPKIFDRFYQADTSSTRKHEGTGIGLSLVKELIEIQGGTIWVESQEGEGTVFRIILPVLDAATTVVNVDAPKLEAEDLKFEVASAIIPTILPKTKEEALKNNFEILLIEDNKDMRTHIQFCIAGNHTIYEAVDGAQGIEMAIEKVPDLIISDVMMPNKDGYEVTKAIRSNINTSHIPIILLTAKTALDSRLKGLDRGADAYLTKPFNSRELNLRIRKLIESRALLQQRFQGVDTKEKEVPQFAFEQEDSFIQTVKTIIEKNIEKSVLNGEFIGKQLGMSRMQVHRKLKALTNQSAREFITEFRLQRGLILLKEGKGDVAEIAYQTGFNTPGYFSKLFKNRFGVTPSKVINERRKTV